METEASAGTASGQRDRGDSVRGAVSFGEITPEGLRETFPQWRIFPGDGSWWAVRGGVEKRSGPESLLLCALGAPDLTALAEKLCIQEWLDGLDEQTLAAVYQGTLMGNLRHLERHP